MLDNPNSAGEISPDIALRDFPKLFFATMPRSGTWYSFFLFEFLDMALTGSNRVRQINEARIHFGTKIVKCHGHSIFPNFEQIYKGPYRSAWDDLNFYCNAFNSGHNVVEQAPEQFSPLQSDDLKIIYLYRNPLDQMVSAFHHNKGSLSEQHRTYLEPKSGERVPFSSVSEYLRQGGLEGYIKQFFSYHEMRENPNLMMIKYENLVAEPCRMFEQMIEFVGFDTELEEHREAIENALTMAAPDRVRDIERKLGRALAQDQSDPNGSHLRGGQTGKWKNELSPVDIKFCLNELSRFDIPAESFIFE